MKHTTFEEAQAAKKKIIEIVKLRDGVSFGIGVKEKKRNPRHCVCIYVQEGYEDQMKSIKIPNKIDGIDVVYKSIGKVKHLAIVDED